MLRMDDEAQPEWSQSVAKRDREKGQIEIEGIVIVALVCKLLKKRCIFKRKNEEQFIQVSDYYSATLTAFFKNYD